MAPWEGFGEPRRAKRRARRHRQPRADAGRGRCVHTRGAVARGAEVGVVVAETAGPWEVAPGNCGKTTTVADDVGRACVHERARARVSSRRAAMLMLAIAVAYVEPCLIRLRMLLGLYARARW